MYRYIKKNWKQTFIAILVGLIASALQIATNLVMIQAFQKIILLDLKKFLLWAVILMLVWISLLWLDGLASILEARAIRSMNNCVRRDMADCLLQKDYQEYHATTTGEYISWFTNDINQIENLAWQPFFRFVKAVSTVVFSIIALVLLHWALLIASLITTVVLLIMPKLFGKKMESLSHDFEHSQSLATGRIKDSISGFDVLRSFSRESRFINNIDVASDQIEKPKYKLSFAKNITSAGIGCINILCQALLTILIGFLSIKGLVFHGTLLGGGNICGALSNGLGTMVQLLLSLASSKSFFEKISLEKETDFAKPESLLPAVKDSIQLKNVSFSYGDTQVLNNVCFEFKKGGKYAVVGPSGSGKTTLLKILLGWLPDYSGEILVDGDSIRLYSDNQLQKQISYIEQDVFLFNSTIQDNITLGCDFNKKQLMDALKASALDKDIEQLPNGLNTIVGDEGTHLSGGQMQRVAIARALIHNRSILLIDEGTSSLDQKNADIIERGLLSNPELTLIMISHHLSPERLSQFQAVLQV